MPNETDILGEGMIKHVVRKGVPLNQYKQFKTIWEIRHGYRRPTTSTS